MNNITVEWAGDLIEKRGVPERYKADHDALEAIMDRRGLSTMIEMVADVAFEKAEHVRSNWQDKSLASRWERDGTKLSKLVRLIHN